jgi:hypothetical protein
MGVDAAEMGVGEDFYQALLDRLPLLGTLGVRHADERFYAFHCAVRQRGVLVDYAQL